MENQEMKLSTLVNRTELILREKGYSDLYILYLKKIWDCLYQYLREINTELYNSIIGINFLDSVYGISVYEKQPSKKRRCIRAINILSDFLIHGVVFSRRRKQTYEFSPEYQPAFQSFIDHKRDRGYSEDTIKSYMIYLSRLSDYLISKEVKEPKDLASSHVFGFIDTFTRYSPSVIHCSLCAIRTFFHYLFENKVTTANFATIVPHDSYRKRSQIPSAYPKEDVEKTLDSIDRGNPKGKRDYAIILIAARLGVRAQDICNLSFSNINWDKNTLQFEQNKTGKMIVLPLLNDVGDAIIDYLKYGRPEVDDINEIFLRLTPPVGKLEAPTLHSIVSMHMRNAGVRIQNGKKHGPHALRHSLASALLQNETPLPIISEILGHTSSKSTAPYLKIDITQLKKFPLDPPPFLWNKGKEEF
jgi:integrase/recombinase XerD